MKYTVQPYNGEVITIETSMPIKDLLKQTADEMIELKDGALIGKQFLQNSIIREVREEAQNRSWVAM